MRALALLGMAIAACGTDEIPVPPECNGSLDLCDRRYDEVVYPTTHNSMSNAEDGWTEPNQNRNLGHQLDDGVRAFMLDAHHWEGEALLCHAICALGSIPLVDALDVFDEFLRTHRGEVITFIFESYVTADEMADAFAASGIDRRVHVQSPAEPWRRSRPKPESTPHSYHPMVSW